MNVSVCDLISCLYYPIWKFYIINWISYFACKIRRYGNTGLISPHSNTWLKAPIDLNGILLAVQPPPHSPF